jgi:hypothetical protein
MNNQSWSASALPHPQATLVTNPMVTTAVIVEPSEVTA